MTKLQRETLRQIKNGGFIVSAPAGVFAYNAEMQSMKVNRNTLAALMRKGWIGATSSTVAGSVARVRYDITITGVEAALSSGISGENS